MDQSGKINRMHKSNPNLSVSFEVLKKEIQERGNEKLPPTRGDDTRG